ncbi:MAG: recombinase family protein [Gammaproteobacteria bacterium]|nr:recombinase family protein [Gammaproteobacteria bacterium]
MALVGWMRVSTTEQSLDEQEALLNEAGTIENFGGSHSGRAGGKNKDELERLIKFVRSGDTVVVTKIDRLGRSLREVLNTVDALREKNVTLKALQQPIDTSENDAFSNAMLQLLGVFAEMERTFIVERTQAGKLRTGNYGGRSKIISESDRDDIRRRNTAGETQYALAKEYKVSRQTINRIVHEAQSVA